jgi:hypothetical protein
MLKLKHNISEKLLILIFDLQTDIKIKYQKWKILFEKSWR